MRMIIDGRLARLLAAGTGVLVAMTGIAAPAYAGAAPTPGASGLGDRLYPKLGNGGYDVKNYDLRLRYPAKNPRQAITGDVTVTAVATQNLSRFDLDFAGKTVGAVSVNGRAATFSRSGEELVIKPARYLAKGKRFTVKVIGFTATPTPANADAPDGWVATADGTVLAGQPNSSHKLFPSNDHPRDMATYTIRLTTPTGWTGVANGKHLSDTVTGSTVTSVYRESKPMASELVQVVAGDFVVRNRARVNGVPIRDVVPRRLANKLLPKAAIERSQLAWMAKRVGPYPFENYGSLVIDADLGFALETQTLSLYDTGLFGQPAYILNPIMAHELAHQWFGDSVAPKSWSDVWQNEGHATWYELRYASDTKVFKKYTGYANETAFYKAMYQQGNLWRKKYGPVARPARSTSVWDVFNPNVYGGGALALYALQQKIGAKKFQKLERAWVSKYRGKSASTADFIALASKISGRNLKPFLKSWLYGTKVPPMPGHKNWKPARSSSAADVAQLDAFHNLAAARH